MRPLPDTIPPAHDPYRIHLRCRGHHCRPRSICTTLAGVFTTPPAQSDGDVVALVRQDSGMIIMLIVGRPSVSQIQVE